MNMVEQHIYSSSLPSNALRQGVFWAVAIVKIILRRSILTRFDLPASFACELNMVEYSLRWLNIGHHYQSMHTSKGCSGQLQLCKSCSGGALVCIWLKSELTPDTNTTVEIRPIFPVRFILNMLLSNGV